MDISKLLDNNKSWTKEMTKGQENFFKNLCEGQAPQALYIGCSDSRVSPELFLSLNPGDFFIHRNIANQVIPSDTNLSSILEFAIDVIKVENIIVCGHYGCGGVEAALSELDPNLCGVWLTDLHAHLKAQNVTDWNEAVEVGVKYQTAKLVEVPVVKRAINNKQILIHTWIFDMSTGEVVSL